MCDHLSLASFTSSGQLKAHLGRGMCQFIIPFGWQIAFCFVGI